MMVKKVDKFQLIFDKMLQYTKGAYFVSELSSQRKLYEKLLKTYNQILQSSETQNIRTI